MVCLGNICRSPLAEGILKSKSDQFFVDSAGTADYHLGKAPDPRSILEASKHGIDIKDQKARQVVPDDFDRFDVIFAMDPSVLEDLKQMAPTDAHKEKIKLILENNPKTNAVPDPYYDGPEGFAFVYDLLDKALEDFVQNPVFP
ncbi:MAG: protein-tyrosine-phosphatase [Flavobacteriaceae bacterium]|nr:MAG: protein-tyrosine-phosphatase [Flavobacteriaceae bacterium]